MEHQQQQQELPPAPIEKLSFAGSGFLCIYYAGVIAAFKKYAWEVSSKWRITSSSSGSIAAVAMASNVRIEDMVRLFEQVLTKARSGSLHALSPNFDILVELRKRLEELLPENAHILCSNRLLLSVTRVRDFQNIFLTEFSNRAELIEAVCCSCFIPGYCGLTPPTYRGEACIDGGITDDQPGRFDAGTVTISPWSGETDICPQEEEWTDKNVVNCQTDVNNNNFGVHKCNDENNIDGANITDAPSSNQSVAAATAFLPNVPYINFGGVSIRWTPKNIRRACAGLLPTTLEESAAICREGFQDAVRFLAKRGLISSSAHAVLPPELEKVLSELEAAHANSWSSWLDRQWAPVRWSVKIAMPTVKLPLELCQFMLNKCHQLWLKQQHAISVHAYVWNLLLPQFYNAWRQQNQIGGNANPLVPQQQQQQ